MSKLEERVKRDFDKQVQNHQMQVLLDDGVHRHLYFHDGSSIYHFMLVTWPGYLCICGDMGCFVFSRIVDMFDFFTPESGRINPYYWSEKLQDGRERAERYSADVLRQQVDEWLEYQLEELRDGPDAWKAEYLKQAVEEQIFGDSSVYDSEHAAHEALERFSYEGIYIHDTWEWAMRDWDTRFLWCCYAIVWGIQMYRAQKAVAA